MSEQVGATIVVEAENLDLLQGFVSGLTFMSRKEGLLNYQVNYQYMYVILEMSGSDVDNATYTLHSGGMQFEHTGVEI